MAQSKIVLIRMRPELFDDVEAIREYIAETTKQAPTVSDAIRLAIATMAAEIKQSNTKENDSE